MPSLRGAVSSVPVWAPALVGVVWGAPCYWLGERVVLRRLRLLGLLTFFVGIVVGAALLLMGRPAPGDPGQILGRTFAGVGLLTVTCGLAFVISGLVTFLRYRKENPTPYGQDNGQDP